MLHVSDRQTFTCVYLFPLPHIRTAFFIVISVSVISLGIKMMSKEETEDITLLWWREASKVHLPRINIRTCGLLVVCTEQGHSILQTVGKIWYYYLYSNLTFKPCATEKCLFPGFIRNCEIKMNNSTFQMGLQNSFHVD